MASIDHTRNLGAGPRRPAATRSEQPRPVVVRLHTRHWGEPRWLDRGETLVPRRAVEATAGALRHDGVTYVVEDVFDDGRRVDVWARVAGEDVHTARDRA